MDLSTQQGKLTVRSSAGDTRELQQFAEPRLAEVRTDGEWLVWARDQDGRWYSWTKWHDALVESSSGQLFEPVTAVLDAGSQKDSRRTLS